MIPSLVFLTSLLPTPATPAVAVDAEPAFFAEDAPDAGKPDGPVVPQWTGSVTIGATYSDGNTDSRAIAMNFDAERRAEIDRWTAKGYWNYSESRDATGEFSINQRRAALTLKYDYFLTKKLYLFGIAGIDTDTLAGISDRTYVGAGAGYQWKEQEDLKWSSEAGLTYFNVDYKSSDDREYLAARLANNIDWKINESTTFQNLVELYPSLESASNLYGKSDTKIRSTLSKTMYAQLQWVYQFTNEPADGKERNDNLLILGVGWSF